MDVKLAFLNSDLEEELYVRQPPRFSISQADQVLIRHGMPSEQGSVWASIGTTGMVCQAAHISELPRFHVQRP
jgi:hypothetical protein